LLRDGTLWDLGKHTMLENGHSRAITWIDKSRMRNMIPSMYMRDFLSGDAEKTHLMSSTVSLKTFVTPSILKKLRKDKFRVDAGSFD
jgi:hypothetical protein